MSASAMTISFLRKSDSSIFKVMISPQNADFEGKKAVYSLIYHAKIKHDSPIHNEKILFEHSFTITSTPESFEVPVDRKIFSYEGKMLDLEVISRLSIERFGFDKTIEQVETIPGPKKRRIPEEEENPLIDAPDQWSIWNHIAIFSAQKKVFMGAWLILCVGSMMLYLTMYIVDIQFLSRLEAYKDIFIVAGGFGLGLFALFFIFQLKSHNHFEKKEWKGKIKKEGRYSLDQFFSGTSGIPLKNLTLRVIACNMEHGQYWSGGKRKSVIPLDEPVRAVLLYEKTVDEVRKGDEIASYFKDSFSFEKIFPLLYPPSMVSGTHGLSVHFEIQFRTPDFLDHKLSFDDEKYFEYDDFLENE